MLFLMFCQRITPPTPNFPAPPAPTFCYDKLGKFILLCAIRLLAQFPLRNPARTPSANSPAHYLHSLQFRLEFRVCIYKILFAAKQAQSNICNALEITTTIVNNSKKKKHRLLEAHARCKLSALFGALPSEKLLPLHPIAPAEGCVPVKVAAKQPAARSQQSVVCEIENETMAPFGWA